MDKTSLGDRMKGYEAVTKNFVLRRTPVIIRVDGKAFHTWTKQITPEIDITLHHGPYSMIMHSAMQAAAVFAAQQMQNIQLAYIQSDEISFYLKDWETHETQQWFGGNVQKMASITASAVTAGFAMHLNQHVPALLNKSWPMFDARVFQVPKEEVANYFIWRQQDATRNSINMLGQFYFSHREMYGKSVSDVQDMLMEHHNVNWNNLEAWEKRGSCVIRRIEEMQLSDTEIIGRSRREVDTEIPIFTKQREYIEDLL